MSSPNQSESPGLAAATGMFIEVLVVGIGSLSALVGFGAALTGYKTAEQVAPVAGSTLGAGVALAVAYALGILVDRCADFLLKSKRRRLRAQYFPSSSGYAAARRLVSKFPDLVARADYARSRMRICRGWIVNGALLFVSADLVLARFPVQNRIVLISAVTVLGLLLTAGFYLAWKDITLTSYMKLHQQAQIPEAAIPAQDAGLSTAAGSDVS